MFLALSAQFMTAIMLAAAMAPKQDASESGPKDFGPDRSNGHVAWPAPRRGANRKSPNSAGPVLWEAPPSSGYARLPEGA